MTGELPEAVDGREPTSEILARAGMLGLGSGESSLLTLLLCAAYALNTSGVANGA